MNEQGKSLKQSDYVNSHRETKGNTVQPKCLLDQTPYVLMRAWKEGITAGGGGGL